MKNKRGEYHLACSLCRFKILCIATANFSSSVNVVCEDSRSRIYIVLLISFDRLLRILSACRPNATHSVPDYTLSAKNLPLATFINAETFSDSSPDIYGIKKEPTKRLVLFNWSSRHE